MKIEVYCNACENDDGFKLEMDTHGPLYLNTETGSQAQDYHCSNCKNVVTVIVLVD